MGFVQIPWVALKANWKLKPPILHSITTVKFLELSYDFEEDFECTSLHYSVNIFHFIIFHNWT